MLELSQTTPVRRGRLQTRHGVIETPFFMAVATKGAVKHLLPEELKALGAQIVLGNTYHLWLRPGDEIIAQAGLRHAGAGSGHAKAGGLHRFMQWDGPILTDSGGFQVFSLGARATETHGKNWVKLTEEGVHFKDPLDGQNYFLSPEKSIEVQLALGSDIIMALDECTTYPCAYEDAKRSMELTLRWAERTKIYFESRMTDYESREKPLLFGIIQGSVYEDLRKECARRLVAMDFDGYAIGGVAVGEPREQMQEILEWIEPMLPQDKPRYLMGLGKPEEIVMAVKAGMDMFDCVIPTREGRHGRLFRWKSQLPITKFQFPNGEEKLFYETLNITNEQYREDFTPVDEQCECTLCRNFTRAYLRYLFAIGEPLAQRLASTHNLRFYLKLMERFR